MTRPVGVNPALLAERRAGVPNGAELRRVCALPTRVLDGQPLVHPWTQALKLPSGTRTLKAFQAAALAECANLGGAAVLAKPGAGKTTVLALAPLVMQAQRPVYFCPANARHELVTQAIPELRQHWRIPHHLVVRSYGELSTKNGRTMLKSLMPDLLLLDEVQELSNVDCARGNRLVEYMAEFPATKVVISTGSPSVRDLTECWHLFMFALRGGTPLPMNKHDAEVWSFALGSDVDDFARMSPGALRVFVDLLSQEERLECQDDLERVRRGFQRRMALTPGVIKLEGAVTDVQVRVTSPTVVVPAPIRQAFQELHATWSVGDEELTDAIEFNAAAKQLICGFYYKWVWPNGEVNKPWLEARKAWHKFVRHVVIDRPARSTLRTERRLANNWPRGSAQWLLPVGLDSKGLVEDACRYHEAYELAKKEPGHPLLEKLEDVVRLDSPEYRAWLAVRHEYTPVTEAVWLDGYLLDYAQEWIKRNHGVVWVFHREFGERLAARGVPYFGGGKQGAEISAFQASCAASFKSHYKAKNLQQWHKCLYLLPPGNGQHWEQSIARFDRTGQKSDHVDCEVLILCRQAFDSWQQALRDAHYADAAFDDQRLLKADISEVLKEEDIENLRLDRHDPLWIS